MYPLRFDPLFRRYLWGGRKLADQLGKTIGVESAAESWEIVDHGNDQSLVVNGDLAGTSLRQLITTDGVNLLGGYLFDQISASGIPTHLQNRFPLLFKFLDARRTLSVQVHPDDVIGRTLSPPDLGKTEAWVVLQADPGARIFAGLKQGVSRELFQRAIENNEMESVLHDFEAKRGDCVFIQAGTVHAIGAGLLIAEIQQSSDTTFRIFDWGRVDQDGKPRELHVQQALNAIDFDRGPVSPQPIDRVGDSQWQPLVDCDKFAINHGVWDREFEVGGDGLLRIITVMDGSVSVQGDPSDQPMNVGDTVMLPACLGPTFFSPLSNTVEVLEFHVPPSVSKE